MMARLATLSEAELFAGLSDEQIDRVAALGRERRIRRGDVLFGLGADADTIYLVRDGEVELTVPLRVLGEVRDVRVQTVGAGGVLAWSALVSPHKLTMAARAISDGELIGFARADTDRLFAREPALGLAVTANLAQVIAARLNQLQALWAREVQRSVSQSHG